MGQSASNDAVHPEQINLFIHQSPIIVSVADGYLRVQFNLHSSEQQNVIAKLKPDQQNRLAHKMEVQLLDLGLQSFTFLDFPEISAAGYTDIPISERMTQESFMRTVEQVQRAEVIMQDNIEEDFKEVRAQH